MKRSNYFLIVVFLLFACSSLFAQWTVQNSGIPTGDQVVLAAVNENIGEGFIGMSGFKNLAKEKRLHSKHWMLEVPGFAGEGPDAKNVTRLRSCFK